MARSIVIIDCGVGNHGSVRNALHYIGEDPVISSDPKAIAEASHLILPGVGSFAEGMAGIHQRKLEPVIIKEVREKKKPILGICLGMQLFATTGREHGSHAGLNVIPGIVELIDTAASGLRLPQIGWNNVRITGKHRITQNFSAEPIFYFVHSYHLLPDDPSVVAGICDYGGPVNAILEHGNVFGAQFHPEKSHDDGMQIFKNFLSC